MNMITLLWTFHGKTISKHLVSEISLGTEGVMEYLFSVHGIDETIDLPDKEIDGHSQ
jgi:hypothetical protein